MRILRSIAFLSLLIAPGAFAQDAAAAKPLTVIDLRPAEEKSGHALAELPGKCNRDVFRIADVASDPSKLDVLTEDMRSYLGEGGNGKTLTVLNWSIYYNRQVQKSGGGLGNIGVQGYSLPGKKKERKAGSLCSKQESAGGWYQADELTSVYFPLISEFEGTVAGKRVLVRVVHSPRIKLPGEFTGDAADTEHLVAAAHETAEAIANQLNP
jgi:hypothetical protein